MTNLLMIREWYRKGYSRYAIVIDIGIRFVISLVAVLMINANIGAMSLLNSPLVAAVAACGKIPAAPPETVRSDRNRAPVQTPALSWQSR